LTTRLSSNFSVLVIWANKRKHFTLISLGEFHASECFHSVILNNFIKRSSHHRASNMLRHSIHFKNIEHIGSIWMIQACFPNSLGHLLPVVGITVTFYWSSLIVKNLYDWWRGGLKGARRQGASPLKCPLFRISKVGNPNPLTKNAINDWKWYQLAISKKKLFKINVRFWNRKKLINLSSCIGNLFSKCRNFQVTRYTILISSVPNSWKYWN
jgi:hypothetical protein